MHYGMGVMPAEVLQTARQSNVESGVQLVQRWIVTALRHHLSYSVDEPEVR